MNKKSFKQPATPGMKVYPKHVGRFCVVQPEGLSKEHQLQGKVVGIYRMLGINWILVDVMRDDIKKPAFFTQDEVVKLENDILSYESEVAMTLDPKTNIIYYDLWRARDEVFVL